MARSRSDTDVAPTDQPGIRIVKRLLSSSSSARPGSLFIVAMAVIIAVQLATADLAGAVSSRRAPLPAGSLVSVSCLAGGWCAAVGNYGPIGSISRPLIEHRTGGRWAQDAAPRSTDFSHLDAVSCSSRRSCMAIGAEVPEVICTPTSCPDRTFVARWNGKRWTRGTVPLPPLRSRPALLGLSCVTARFCMAVGGYVTPSLSACTPPQTCQPRPLVDVWTGRRWRTLALPGILGSLSSVSCSSVIACTAVGTGPGCLIGLGNPTGFECTGPSDPLALRYDGHAFKPQPATSVPNATRSALNDVSCPSPHACMAIGVYVYDPPQPGGIETEPTFAEHWTSGAWTLAPAEASTRSTTVLDAVSCATAAACTAVGSAIDGITGRPTAEHWNGTTWRTESPPSPPNAPGYSNNSYFKSVSCPTKPMCVAVGSENYTNGTTDGHRTLAETQNGRTWKIEPSR